MNLVQEKPVDENKQKKLGLSLIVVIVLIVILMCIAVYLYLYMQNVIRNQLKVYIDGVQQSDRIESAFYIDGDKVYTSVFDIAKAIGYTAYPGGYKEYTQSKNSCYATNSSELVTFSANSDIVRKYPSGSEAQDFQIDEAISQKGSTLYISQSGLERAYNLKISYNKSENTINIMTLSYITSRYEKSFENASITKSDLSETVIFNNEKALLNNLVVVRDLTSRDKMFGVSLYKNNELIEVISPRYTSVEYVEGMEDFIVRSTDNKYGIIGHDGITKVTPKYDQIVEIDKNYGLYLFTSGGKQGIVNQNGKIIVYPDYDKIGLVSSSEDNNVKNRYLLLDNCIPVMRGNKWGFIDKNGNEITKLEYDVIGCTSFTKNTNSNGITLIPDIPGIVVGKVYNNNTSQKVWKYGIINDKGVLVVAINSDAAFATTLRNQTKYYLSISGQNVDIVEYWNTHYNDANNDASKVTNTTNTTNTANTTNTTNGNAIVNQAQENATQENGNQENGEVQDGGNQENGETQENGNPENGEVQPSENQENGGEAQDNAGEQTDANQGEGA